MRERLSYLSVDDDFFSLPPKTPYKANTLRVSPKFKYQEEGSALEDVVLKPAPKFFGFFPRLTKLTPKKYLVSSAHLNAYQVMLGMPKFVFDYKNKLDKESFVQIKKYGSASK